MSSEYAVFLGLDVGKGEHHACALDPAGKKLHDKPLPNDEQRLRALFSQLSKHGKVLVVVDQPASIGALPVAVARASGCQVAYLPGLTMRRLADIHPGNAKTDARDAFVIADAARTLPHALRRGGTGDETLAELEVLAGFDDDLAGEATRLANRIRGLLVTIHPALEKALGPRLRHPAALELLSRYGGPAGLRAAGPGQLLATARPLAPRLAGRLVQEIMSALEAQTVVVPGTSAAETVLPHLARSLTSVQDQRKQVAAQVEEILDALPLARVLISMPGFGIRTAARVLLEIGDIAAFPTPRHPPPLPRPRPRPPPLRLLHPRRAPAQRRQQSTQARHVPRRVRVPVQPAQQGLLRPQASRRQETQRRPHLPRTPPLRRHLRHAPRPPPLPARTKKQHPERPSRLTKTIGTPPHRRHD